jgi:Dihydropteroate synthase and related enzymes
MIWRTSRRAFDLADRGLIMGIVNVTPDSFSDGGHFARTDDAVAMLCVWPTRVRTSSTSAASRPARALQP